MTRFAKNLANLIALLVISGMMLHLVVPHHHHETTGEVSACCESHHHNDTDSHTEKPCTILSHIHFESFKPQVTVYTQDLKHGHLQCPSATCPNCLSIASFQISEATPVYTPDAVPNETAFQTSYSHRGPPSLFS